jgi:hypothetical protein
MIVYKIKKPGFVQTIVNNMLGYAAPQAPVVHQLFPKMGKLEFDRWLDTNVRNKFKVGDRVCMNVMPILPNNVPYFYTVSFINELWYNAKWDSLAGEPSVVACDFPQGGTTTRAPSTLRLLTEEENKLANLRDTKAQGSA